MHLNKSIPFATRNIIITNIFVLGIQILSIFKLVKQRKIQNTEKEDKSYFFFIYILIAIILTFCIPVKITTTHTYYKNKEETTLSNTNTIITDTYYNLFSIPITKNNTAPTEPFPVY